jgi:Beta propeller domain
MGQSTTGRRRVWAAFAAGTAIGATAGALLISGAFATNQPSGPVRDAVGPPGELFATPVAADRLPAFDSCERLRRWYVAAALPDVGPWGFQDSYGGDLRYPFATYGKAAMPLAGLDTATGNGGTGTNVQDAGVDEPDIAKTNGSLVVRLQGQDVVVIDVTGSRPRALSRIPLPNRLKNKRLLLVGDRVVVFGEQPTVLPGPIAYGGPDTLGRRFPPGVTDTQATYVVSIDISDPADAKVVSKERVDGDLISAREYADGTVRMVLTTGHPPFDFVFPNGHRTIPEARRENRQIIRDTTIGDWLPQVRQGSGPPQPLLACSDVRHPKVRSGFGTISVLSFPADNPTDRDTTAVTAAGDLAYSSNDRLYVATTPAYGKPRTQVHSFAVDGSHTTYAASGSVPGWVKDRWSFDEYDGHLRVATTLGPNIWSPRENAVFVLDEHGGRLRQVGRVDGIGRHESIKSVRWFGDLAVLVTYRRIDPLYTVDLSSPERPRVIGSLSLPGNSAYLHPIGHGRLLGLGRGGTWSGAQAATYDLRHPANVRRIDTIAIGEHSRAVAGARPRAFTFLPEQRVALFPVQSNYDGHTMLVAIGVGDRGGLSHRHAWELRRWSGDRVRALPLGGGRVALVDRGVRVIQVG